jgi:hypothetical protein
MMNDLPIVAAGREVPDALDHVRRYCGLRWSGGFGETWAWPYYDVVPSGEDHAVSAVDVLCASALHPGLSRDDLTFFRHDSAAIASWLSGIPSETRVGDLTGAQLAHLRSLPELGAPSLSLLTKVLHRKRPHAIPLLDRHIIDWYRPVTRKRAATEAWAPLIDAIHDEALDDERRLKMAIVVGGLESELWPDLAADQRPGVSWLRVVDIAIWMGSR